MSRISQRSKAYERSVAKDIGSVRNFAGSRNPAGGDPGDVAHERYFIEVRDRQHPHPLAWWLKTRIKAKSAQKTPMLIFKAESVAFGPLALLEWSELRRLLHYARAGGAFSQDNRTEAWGGTQDTE